MWAAIVVVGLASYVLRVLPLLLLGRLDLPERVTEALQHAAMGAMVVMLVSAAVQAAGVGTGPVAGAQAGDTVSLTARAAGVVAGVGLGLALGRRGRPMPVVVVASLSVFAAVSWAVVAVGSRVG